MQSREVYLPIGLQNCQILDRWTGEDARIFFICPDVEGIPYYRQIYLDFKKQFSGLPYAIGGAQALATSNPHVLGYVPDAEHQRNMREFRVMYYHSTEPNHIHYHPFEAVRAGMPLVFLAGGMLDKLGGSALPGRCRGVAEARAKLSRILAGDQDLIGKIRASQPVLLEKMRPAGLESAWRAGLDRVLSELERSRVARPAVTRRPRIGVVVPLNYRGGTLRSAKLLAEAIGRGSRQFSEDADVVFAYPAEAKDEQTADRWDVGLPSFVSKRTIAWHVLDPDSAQRAMRYAGHAGWVAVAERYMVPDDRREYLLDCDLWIIVSDRISIPLLPIRPYLMVVYDYIQRYEHQDDTDAAFLAAAKRAQRVLVTTRFTEQDALTYAGIPRERLFRVPMLVPDFIPGQTNLAAPKTPYFLWTTNRGRHKNHYNAFCALREYYELADGKLRCRVTGVESESLLRGGAAHLEPLKGIVAQSPKLARQLRIVGELSDAAYRKMLAGSCFLWHPAQIDNGTLAAVEAAMIGVPTLSSRYPAMEEMQEHFDLRLKWMDSTNPSEMAQGLKWMEEHLTATRAEAASRQEPVGSSAERSAAAYWKVIRECL
jgi:glycosyltransferase involved in cell wall biosynthesis